MASKDHLCPKTVRVALLGKRDFRRTTGDIRMGVPVSGWPLLSVIMVLRKRDRKSPEKAQTTKAEPEGR